MNFPQRNFRREQRTDRLQMEVNLQGKSGRQIPPAPTPTPTPTYGYPYATPTPDPE